MIMITELEYEKIKSYYPDYSFSTKISNIEITNVIIYKIKTGCPWSKIPSKYGKWRTIYRRLFNWNKLGLLDNIIIALYLIGALSFNESMLFLETFAKPNDSGIDNSTYRSLNSAYRTLKRKQAVSYIYSIYLYNRYKLSEPH